MVIQMIKYPNNIVKKEFKKNSNFGNRGMSLESDLNSTNIYYLENNIAVIHKKPTPIQVVETKEGKITKAYFKEPSTTDYNGIYNGHYVDFEAKETMNTTNFPLNNIHKHQIEHMKKILNQKGICFLIVRFTKLNETYLLFAKDFIDYLNNNGRKSIPIAYFKEKGKKIEYNLKIKVDYIKFIS